METQFGEHCLLNGEQMTGKIMDFTEFSFVGVDDIRSFISGCGIEKLLARMDFCRELTSVFRQLSSRLFSNEQDRIRLIDTAQEHLDGIVAEEYEQEDEDDEAEEGRR
jgi:type III secretion system TyeA family effector delivery regulator